MKKIALAAAAMGGTALIAFGASGTFAAFSDTETIANQAVGGAIIDLTVSGPSATPGKSPVDLLPGGTMQFAYYVNNAGNIDGTLKADLTAVGSENGCTDAERKAPFTCTDSAGPGQFVEKATYQAFTVPGVDASGCKITASPVASLKKAIAPAVPLKTASDAGMVEIASVPAGTGLCYIYEVVLDKNADNSVQSDRATLGIKLALEQVVAKQTV